MKKMLTLKYFLLQNAQDVSDTEQQLSRYQVVYRLIREKNHIFPSLGTETSTTQAARC